MTSVAPVPLGFRGYCKTVSGITLLCRKATAAADAARQAARDEQNRLGLQEGAPSMFAFINTRLSDSADPGEGLDRQAAS